MGYPHKRYPILLLLTEGLTVSTLIHSRICLMGANQDPLQGAVVCVFAVMCALRNSTFDTLIRVTIHNDILLSV